MRHLAAAPLPQDPEPLTMVPHEALGPLLAGTKQIVPDDDTKSRLAHAYIRMLADAFEYCVGQTGRVYRVQTIRSTGVPAYDHRIAEKMQQ